MIENRTIIKEAVSILITQNSIDLLQTKGGALIREGTLNWQNMVGNTLG